MIAGAIPFAVSAQSAIDAYRFSQPDLKGTARFMSMGGAFGALGGDLSTISQNPAGIGVYRNSEIGFTLDLDCQRATSGIGSATQSTDQTKFLLNNIGGVATLRLPSSTMPNINFGFTYNKGASFNRQYAGVINGLDNSMSNYIAGIANSNEITVADLETTDHYDPYNPNDGGYAAPWMTILGYDSYLINANGNPDNPHWTGQWGTGTTGNGGFSVNTKGSVDEYNVAIGGNISNFLYWGMNFDIINFNYQTQTLWTENLSHAYVDMNNEGPSPANAKWNLYNSYRASGSGFNYQLGFIVKPIQELRIGFAFHTPTWYNLTESYYGRVNYDYQGTGNKALQGYAETNEGYTATNYYNFRTPWKIMASVAGVIGSNLIVSADYEWANYGSSRFSVDNDDYYGYGWDNDYDDWYYPYMDYSTKSSASNDPYGATNKDIKRYYRSTNTFRIGAEYRVTPQFSVRAGYCNVSSPVKESAKENREIIYTSGTMPNYRFDNSTNYITCGFGYRYKKFYIDMAYVYKHMSSEYHAYTADPSTPNIPSPQSKLSFNNNQVVLSVGFKL